MTELRDTDPLLPPASDDHGGPEPRAAVVDEPLRASRAGNTWVGITVFAVVLVFGLIFILQNTQSVRVAYVGMSGHLSLAVAMLMAAVAGMLLTATAGSLRIWQLRRRMRQSIRRSRH